MKRRLPGLVLVAILAVSFAACAPQAAPPAAPATPAAPAPPPVAAPALTAEEKAWEQVVAAAQKEGTVTVYSFGWKGDIGTDITRAFQEKFGIKMEIIAGRGAEFLERLKTEGRSGRIVGDLFEGSTSHSLNLKNSGLTTASAKLPALKDLNAFIASPLAMDTEGHVLGYNIYIYHPFVNNNLVKPGEEPRAWNDLLDPRWKGKMLLGSPVLSMEAYNLFWPLKAAGVVDMEYLRALGKQDIQFTTGTAENALKLSRGEKALAILGTPVEYSVPLMSGAPIRAIPMEPATPAVVGLAMVAVKNSPHPNATQVLVNWILSAEGQLAHNRARGTPSILKSAPSFLPKAADVKASRLILVTQEVLEDEAKSFNEKILVKLWGL